MRMKTSYPGLEIEITEKIVNSVPVAAIKNTGMPPELAKEVTEMFTRMREHVMDKDPYVDVRFWLGSFLLTHIQINGDDASRLLSLKDHTDVANLMEGRL